MYTPSLSEFLLHSFRRPAVALLLASTAFAAAACGGGEPAAGGAAGAGGRGGAPMAVPVELLTLVEKPVEQTSEFVGTVRSRLSVNVQAQVEGFIRKINVKSGDRVQLGAVLFEIDDASQLAVIANLESVRAARDADASFAKQQAERAQKLLTAGAMSQQELDQALALQRSTAATLKAIDEQIRQQKNEWGYSRVTASAAGVIGDIPVRSGDRITRQTLLTTIDDNTNLELYVNVPVQEAPRLKVGQAVHVLDEASEVVATERIAFISPSVDDTTQTVLVKTPIAARGGALRASQFVRARVVWSMAPALTVPLVAVTRISGQYFVFVAEAGPNGGLVARQRPVTVGSLVGNDYLVMGGLKAGDKVIVAGIQKIGDGAPVAEAPAKPPKAARLNTPVSPKPLGAA
jgi:RND family efflux transporter MFP subunit